jgi:prevent-host-death family protein
MRYISATEAKQSFAAALDAAQRGPVVIRRQSRDQAVLIPPEEYARLRGIAAADFRRFAIRSARRPPSAARPNTSSRRSCALAPGARVILDTNVLISRLLIPRSVAGRAVSRLLQQTQPLVSEATLGERRAEARA